MEHRVVITGIGAITPIGNNVDEFWKSIKEGKCGITPISLFDSTNQKAKLAAEIKNYQAEEHFEAKIAKRLDRFCQFAMIAAREALEKSGITSENTDMTRVGTVIGSGMGGLETLEEQNRNLVEKGPDRISPMYIPMSITNIAAGNVAID